MVHLYLDRLDAAVMHHPVTFCVEAPISSVLTQIVTKKPEIFYFMLIFSSLG